MGKMAMVSILRARKQQLLGSREKPAVNSNSDSETKKSTSPDAAQPQLELRDVSKADVSRSTRLRQVFAGIASFSYLVAFVFLILVCDISLLAAVRYCIVPLTSALARS